MKRILLFLFLFLFLAVLAAGCRSREEKALEAFTGSTVRLPQDLEYRSLGDSLCPVPEDSLRMVVYINSECERCAAQTSEWAKREQEFLQAGNVAILYYVRAADFPQVQALLERAGLSSPVFIDPESDLLYQNGIPESLTPLHTFLLDGQGRVVLYGDPLDNPFLYRRYREAIRRLSPHRK